MTKKYKLVDHDGSKVSKTLKQIKALRDIPNIGVKKGDLGGFVESENNLSQDGDCWVYGSALVYGDARVCGNAEIESSNDLFNIITFKSYPITITRDNITIGCQTMKRKEWLKVTEKKSIKMGLPKGLYKEYKELLKTGFKIVKGREMI